MKNVIVVAHPDDESLWASSLLLYYPGNWTIICCSRPQAPGEELRCSKFFHACVFLGAGHGVILDHADNGINKPLENLYINLQEYDHIFTHNNVGEYGHPHHKQVHEYIKSKYPDKKQTYFGYTRDGYIGTEIELSPSNTMTKLKALRAYDYPYKGKPYYETLLNWTKKLPYFKLYKESFIGDLPDILDKT